jgi:hypothetical protein
MYQTALELTRFARCTCSSCSITNGSAAAPGAGAERRRRLEYLVRMEGKPKEFGSILPHAVREFASQDLEWRLHREMYLREIDVVQLEYTALSQYGGDYRRLGCVLFEHDIYFQSIARTWPAHAQAPRERCEGRLTSIFAHCAMS